MGFPLMLYLMLTNTIENAQIQLVSMDSQKRKTQWTHSQFYSAIEIHIRTYTHWISQFFSSLSRYLSRFFSFSFLCVKGIPCIQRNKTETSPNVITYCVHLREIQEKKWVFEQKPVSPTVFSAILGAITCVLWTRIQLFWYLHSVEHYIYQ